MLAGAYVPRCVEVTDAQGECFEHTVSFTIDEASELYANSLTSAALIER